MSYEYGVDAVAGTSYDTRDAHRPMYGTLLHGLHDKVLTGARRSVTMRDAIMSMRTEG